MADPAVRELAVGLAQECVAVARAAGADLPEETARAAVDGMASTAAGAGAAFGSSMLYDLEAGRPTEHEALTGAVVRTGERLGVATPLNGAVLALLRAQRTETG